MPKFTIVRLMTANVLLTLLWLALAFGYPGYEFTIYTFGLGLDGGAARNDAFDLQLSLGAALGIPSMAFIDHFNILFVTFAPLAWWRNAKSTDDCFGDGNSERASTCSCLWPCFCRPGF